MLFEHLDTVIAFAAMMLLLSLIVTTLVQMVAAFLNLRGKNLLWGAEELLKQIDPRLEKDARALAEKILKHPALTDRAGRLASAIRSSELVLVLGQIARAEIKNAGTPGTPASGSPAPDARGLSPDALEALQDLFQDKVDPDSPALDAKAQELMGRLTANFPADKVQELRTAVMQTFGTTSEIVVRVDAWFETVMDRASERFKIRSRHITVVLALIFGLGLQVDSLALFERLSTDEALRGRLLTMADTVSEQAETLLASSETGNDFASIAIRNVLQDPRFATGESAARLTQVKAALRERSEGEEWLNAQLAGAADRDAFLAAYRERYPEVVKARLDELQGTLSQLQGKVETISPGLLPGSPVLATYADPLAWVGMLMTVAFLSLGAPFWFNALRSLSALKPIVSQKVEKEEKKTA
ncbi:MAG TPA: hypothetical protein VLQ45_33550 [Thermoanaerobaculia bacterium]|nr:hypothetical protein [Thermoanaerobaculia bacterium]